jgi:hypothetical protein
MNTLYYKVLPFIVVYFLVCDSLCAQSGEDSAPGSCPFFYSTETFAANTFKTPAKTSDDPEATLVAVNDHVYGRYNTLSYFLPADNDETLNNPYTLSIITHALHGTSSLSNKYIRYTPQKNFIGRDTIVYQISGSGQTATAEIRITVLPPLIDNINETPECYGNPPAQIWTIREAFSLQYSDHNIQQTVYVGDIDGDGEAEFISANYDNDNSTGISLFNNDGTYRQWIEMKADDNSRLYTFSAGNPVQGVARVKWNATTDKTVIFTAAVYENSLYCYDPINYVKLWKSSAPYATGDGNNGSIRTIPMSYIADLDGDGWSEIVVGNRVYAAESGVLLCYPAGSTAGTEGLNPGWDNYNVMIQVAVADVLELGYQQICIGNSLYRCTITDRSGTAGNTMEVVRTISPVTLFDGTNPPSTDGCTQVADFDLDGHADVLVSSVYRVDYSTTVPSANNFGYFYIWSPFKNEIIASEKAPYMFKKGIPMVGNINASPQPEIVFVHGSLEGNNLYAAYDKMTAYAYNPASANKQLETVWELPHTDTSGSTGMTLFDFNQDGITEIVYRDETLLRIINGSLVDHTTGTPVAEPYNLASIACASATGVEYPTIADVDGDGEAEIIVGGPTSGSMPGVGPIRVFKAGTGTIWAPARNVWNQYAYNSLNINQDLTVPTLPVSPAIVFPGNDGEAFTDDDLQPYNNFLQQQTMLNRDGASLWQLPDIAVTQVVPTAYDETANHATVEVQFVNQGNAKIYPPIQVALFKQTDDETSLIDQQTFSSALDINQTGALNFDIDDVDSYASLDSIVVIINYSETEEGLQTECDLNNNRGAFRMASVALNAIDDRDSTTVNTPILIDVLANDEGLIDCSPIPSITAGLAHGTAQIVDNKIQYTPHANYTGSDSLFYEFECQGQIVSALARIVVMPKAVFDTSNKTECANLGFLPDMLFTGNPPFTVVYKEDGVQKTLTDYTDYRFQTVAPTGEKKTYIILSITDNSGITNPATDTLVLLSGVAVEMFPVGDNGFPIVMGETFNVRIPERDINGVPVEDIVFPLSRSDNADIIEISISSAKDNLSQEVQFPEVVIENVSLTPNDDGTMMLSFNADDMPAIASRTIEGHTTLRPGYVYFFLIEAWQTVDGAKSECSTQRYFNVMVVPDTIVWRPSGATIAPDVLEAPAQHSPRSSITSTTGEILPARGSDEAPAWLYDNNWKHQAYPLREGPEMINGQAAPITNGFVPLRETHVIIPTGCDIYPLLLDREEDFDNDIYFQDIDKHYLRYNYNFVHNKCKVIHFKANSELGRPDRLTYDSAQVDMHVETNRWYALSAPLHGMFTGDFMMHRANPSVEMLFHKQANPDTGGAAVDTWTTEFMSTVSPIAMGQGVAFRAGSSYYPFPDAFKANPDEGVLQPGKNLRDTAEIRYYFPVDSTYYNIYNAVTNALMSSQNLPADAKTLSHRFIFDNRQDNYLSPFTADYSDATEITEFDLSHLNLTNGVENQSIIIGNPLMSHFNFDEFSYVNENQIINEYKFLIQNSTTPYTIRYISVVSLSEENDNGIVEIITNEGDDTVTDHAIAPMQAFMVTTTSSFDKNVPLTIPVSASDTDRDKHSTLRSQSTRARRNVMHIALSRDEARTSAAIAVRKHASVGYRAGEDSRLLLSELDNGASPSVYTEADGRALDINQLPDMPASLPVNITTSIPGRMTFEIKGCESMDCASELRFIDVATGTDIPLQGEPFCYSFDNPTGNITGRFFIARSANALSAPTDANVKIYSSNGRIHAIAANNSKIRSLIISSLDGRILARRNSIDNPNFSIDFPDGQIAVIVKTISDNGITTKKIRRNL